MAGYQIELKDKLLRLIVNTGRELAIKEVSVFFIGNNEEFDNFNTLILDNSVGNLALLDNETNGSKEIGNKPYNEKKVAIYKKMNSNAFVPLSTVLAFTNIYTEEPLSNRYWLFESKSNYLKDIVDTVSNFLKDTEENERS
jgi:hypothetical protein